jgi:DNA helicase-2/ATP-dependent DNA helicase PcrA
MLNQAQQEAVGHKDGPMLVLAGPGSGKTLVITERTKYLINKHKISEGNILVITFTRAASKEMKDRFLKTMKRSKTAVNFGTFHSVFFTILKYAYNLSVNNIIKDDERINCIKSIINKMGISYDDEKEFIAEILSEISMVKGNRIELSSYYSSSCGDEVFRRIYQEYNKKIRQANRIDFDDMLLLCYELLSQREDILRLWQDKFRYILIDEFQDINILQYDIIKLLAKPRNNLFIVGDDDQSIYRFRGARPEIMLNFPKDYPNCKKIFLNINYRSGIKIIETANKLISNNKVRYEKSLKPHKKDEARVVSCQFETMGEQNIKLVEEIYKLFKSGIPLSEMAILVRTNLGAGAIIHKLMEYNIPFFAGDNIPNIYDHWITEDLIAYMRIAMGEDGRGLYLRIINRPKRYISRECFDTSQVNFEDLYNYYEDKEWMIDRIDQLEYDLAMLAGMSPYAAIQYIRRAVGYEDFLKEYAKDRRLSEEELIDVLDEIQEGTKGFDSFVEWFEYIKQYKEELKKQAQHNTNKNIDGIRIMTMHSSKGLEFETVFIVDVNEDITPHKKALLPEDIEEERRLFYVALTRAKKYLYIFSPKKRYNKDMEPSRFINELKGNN